jgi:hypothetical protein
MIATTQLLGPQNPSELPRGENPRKITETATLPVVPSQASKPNAVITPPYLVTF